MRPYVHASNVNARDKSGDLNSRPMGCGLRIRLLQHAILREWKKKKTLPFAIETRDAHYTGSSISVTLSRSENIVFCESLEFLWRGQKRPELPEHGAPSLSNFAKNAARNSSIWWIDGDGRIGFTIISVWFLFTKKNNTNQPTATTAPKITTTTKYYLEIAPHADYCEMNERIVYLLFSFFWIKKPLDSGVRLAIDRIYGAFDGEIKALDCQIQLTKLKYGFRNKVNFKNSVVRSFLTLSPAIMRRFEWLACK